MKTLGDRIQIIRKDHLKYTQDEFAAKIGVSGGNTISNYEKGIREPDISTLIKIADLGHISLDWLLRGKGNTPDGSEAAAKIFYEYPVLSDIAAGIGQVKDHEYPEWKSIDFDPRRYFWLKIDEEYGFSMRPFLRPKEMVLCAYETKNFNDEDMVAVLYDKTKGAVKILNLNHSISDIVVLDSLNPSERPITLKKSQVKAMFKVVLVAKI